MSNARRKLSGEQQGAALRSVFKTFRQVSRGNPFAWEGTLTPIGASGYRVRIAYYPGLVRPQVTVLDPELVPREPGIKIPHTFKSGRVCLHLNEEWNPSMYLHQTIVPWTCLWLYYYEVWHATGEWLGGGHGVANEDKPAEAEAKEQAA
jgi:hypothetical protein